MSQQDTAVEAGIDLIRRKAAAPLFFHVLGTEYNIVPRNEKQAESLLRLGETLLAAERVEVQKQAAADADYFADLADRVERELSGGVDPGPDYARAVKQAAAWMASDPEVATAAATVQAAIQARFQSAG